MKRRLTLAMLLLAAGLTACAAADVVLSPTNFYGAYTPTVVNYSSARGGMPVEVVGNPFDAPKDELNAAISGWMEGSHFGPRVNFLTEPPGDFSSAYRIVMVFDPSQGYTELKLCRESGSIQPGTGEAVRVHAALCAGESPLTGGIRPRYRCDRADGPEVRPPYLPDHDQSVAALQPRPPGQRQGPVLLGPAALPAVAAATGSALHRRAGHVGIGTEDAAVAGARAKQGTAAGAIVEVEAAVLRHGLAGSAAAVRAGEGGFADERPRHQARRQMRRTA